MRRLEGEKVNRKQYTSTESAMSSAVDREHCERKRKKEKK